MATQGKSVSRRDFMKATAVSAAGMTFLAATSARGQAKKTFKIGLVGCGGRGNGAVRDCVNAGKVLGIDVKITALADAYADKVERTQQRLAKEGHEVPKERVFVGFDAYKKLIDSGVDIVLLVTPPNFRPLHFAACIEAGKHVFFEKPVGVDPVGCRKIIETGELAKKKGLGVVAGTIWRHHGPYIATKKAVADGAIGRIVAGRIRYCIGRRWYRERKPEWSPAEYLVRNWINFVEMSGDHIVEQHVHTIDVANWFMDAHPVAAVGMGGRARRITGNQYDYFSVDFEYPNGAHIHSMCRQVNGCWNGGGQVFVGQKGETNGCGRIKAAGEVKLPEVKTHKSPYVQEHIDLLRSIIEGNPLNEARQIAESSLTAVMGRISAYTGKRITWDEMMKSDLLLKPTPEDFETGKVFVPKENVAPVPGTA